jgi:23S rRNA pseudouridine2604 synthase
MSFTRKIVYFLVHGLMKTNAEAKTLVKSGRVRLNGELVFHNALLTEEDTLHVDETLVKKALEKVYLQFYKPVGFQSSLNPKVENNLSAYFSAYPNLSIAGRLDQQSEGLLLLSNDGKWVERMCHPQFEKEKEYWVELDKEMEPDLPEKLAAGVKLGDFTTQTCGCIALSKQSLQMVLKEGKNRQIRRMCHKMGYQVTRLVRIRIDRYNLDPLQPGDIQVFVPDATFNPK